MTAKLKVLDLFSGIGGFSLGLERSGGFETVAFCEIDPFCRRVLAKHWPDVPCYEDVRELTAEKLAADGIAVDVICGGFPCQDISIANVIGKGLEGWRSGLWFEYARLIGEVRPGHVIIENVAELLNRGMGDVLGSLASIGYNAEWRVLRGIDVGLPFIGERIWIVAAPKCAGWKGRFKYLRSLGIEEKTSAERRNAALGARRALDSYLARIREDYGLSVTMERRRLHALGNAVTPEVPKLIGKAILQAEGMRSTRPPVADAVQAAALPWKDLPEFMARLRGLRSFSALALEWTILTACRTNECLQAKRSEVDRATKVWTIPASRMKAGREHRVPLSDRCMEILSELDQIETPWLFPSRVHRKHLSQQAMSECLKGLQPDVTVHGFRSTFRDWVGDATSYPEVLAEAALAHVIGDKTEAAYRRGDALERRRELMCAWERYLRTDERSNVVAIKR